MYDDNHEPDAAPLTPTSMSCRWKDVGIVVAALAIGLSIAVVVAVIVIEAVGRPSQSVVNDTAARDAHDVTQTTTGMDTIQMHASDNLSVRDKRSVRAFRPLRSTAFSKKDDRCDAGWTYSEVSHRCYKFIRPAKSWHEAEADCKLYGGHLATVRSQAENDWIVDFADRHWGRGELTAWIGLSNLHNAGWQWTEGSALKYRNWAPNEPNNAHENCVNIYVNFPSWLNKKWNDFVCDWNLSSICEKPASNDNF